MIARWKMYQGMESSFMVNNVDSSDTGFYARADSETYVLAADYEAMKARIVEARSILTSMRAYMTPGFSIPLPAGGMETFRKAIDDWIEGRP